MIARFQAAPATGEELHGAAVHFWVSGGHLCRVSEHFWVSGGHRCRVSEHIKGVYRTTTVFECGDSDAEGLTAQWSPSAVQITGDAAYNVRSMATSAAGGVQGP